MICVEVARACRLTSGVLAAALAATACATKAGGMPPPPGGSSAVTAPPAAAAPGSTAKPAPQGAAPATPGAAARKMITAKDGTKIVYDVAGSGPFLLMLHGGGQTAKSWEERGYVTRLKASYTLVTMDQRGAGESGRPDTPAAYALDTMLSDILAVADAAGAKRFHVYGFGHGATLGRYLAARSDRVISAVLVSMTMGPSLDGVVKSAVMGMRAKWQPLIDAKAAGTLKLDALSPGDRTAWDGGIASLASFLSALVDYPPLEPSEIKAPTLWLVGAADTSAAENLKAYEGKLAGTKVTLKQLSGASYTDSFARIDPALAEAEPFLKANSTAS